MVERVERTLEAGVVEERYVEWLAEAASKVGDILICFNVLPTAGLLAECEGKAKLEPFLGFLHSVQYAKPSLVCDFVELYRYLMDEFVVQYCQRLRKKDFITKNETYRNRRGKREYLNDLKTKNFMKWLNRFFQSTVEIPRIRIGERQEVETLIREEAWLFAKYLRNERRTWNPRIANL